MSTVVPVGWASSYYISWSVPGPYPGENVINECLRSQCFIVYCQEISIGINGCSLCHSAGMEDIEVKTTFQKVCQVNVLCSLKHIFNPILDFDSGNSRWSSWTASLGVYLSVDCNQPYVCVFLKQRLWNVAGRDSTFWAISSSGLRLEQQHSRLFLFWHLPLQPRGRPGAQATLYSGLQQGWAEGKHVSVHTWE